MLTALRGEGGTYTTSKQFYNSDCSTLNPRPVLWLCDLPFAQLAQLTELELLGYKKNILKLSSLDVSFTFPSFCSNILKQQLEYTPPSSSVPSPLLMYLSIFLSICKPRNHFSTENGPKFNRKRNFWTRFSSSEHCANSSINTQDCALGLCNNWLSNLRNVYLFSQLAPV